MSLIHLFAISVFIGSVGGTPIKVSTDKIGYDEAARKIGLQLPSKDRMELVLMRLFDGPGFIETKLAQAKVRKYLAYDGNRFVRASFLYKGDKLTGIVFLIKKTLKGKEIERWYVPANGNKPILKPDAKETGRRVVMYVRYTEKEDPTIKIYSVERYFGFELDFKRLN